MRNGFRSSRGAMRGIIGGTLGLATVAMGCRSFPVRGVTRMRSSVFSLTSFTWPDNNRKVFWAPRTLTGRDLLRVLRGAGAQMLVATRDGAEVQHLSAF